MEIEEIKDLLSCYHPEFMGGSGGAPVDAKVQEALTALESDSALTDWLAKEQAFDRAFATKLSSYPIPDGLREGILARMNEAATVAFEAEAGPIADPTVEWSPGSGATGMPGDRTAAPEGALIDGGSSFADSDSDFNFDSEASAARSRPFAAIYGWGAIAAAAVITLIAIFGFRDSSLNPRDHEYQSVTDFRQDMSEITSKGAFKNGFQTMDMSEGRDWLASQNSPIYPKVPHNFVRFRGMGCNVLDWGGHKVSLVCFKPNEDLVHLFVLKKEILKDATSPAEPLDKVLVHHNLQNGGWMDDENLYLFVGDNPEVDIGPLLQK